MKRLQLNYFASSRAPGERIPWYVPLLLLALSIAMRNSVHIIWLAGAGNAVRTIAAIRMAYCTTVVASLTSVCLALFQLVRSDRYLVPLLVVMGNLIWCFFW